MNNFYLVIPVRLASTRLPNKVMYKIGGKTILEWIYLKCLKCVNRKNIFVLTEDKEVISFCNSKKIQSILNKKTKTGTDKIYEFSKARKAKFYLNVQGDEIFFSTKALKRLIISAKKNNDTIINCYTKISNNEEYLSRNVPKMVFDRNGYLLYASRGPIPSSKVDIFNNSFKQVCLYSFPYKQLQKFGSMKNKTQFEKFEDIEILRFLELGFKVLLIRSEGSNRAIDTIQDYNFAKKNFKKFYK